MTGILHMLLATQPVRTALSNATIADTQVTAPACSSSVSINRDGTVNFTGNGSDPDPTDEWVIDPVGNPGDSFHVRLTVSSGDAPNAGDAVSSWLALTSDRTWTRSDSASASGAWLVEISRDGGTTVDVSATITMSNTFIP